MGTWGSGNLANDEAADIRDEAAQKLMRQILNRAAHPASAEYDEYDYFRLFYDLEVLFALTIHRLVPSWYFPHPDTVRSLREGFMRGYDAYCSKHPIKNPEFSRERRRVIQRTFNKFHPPLPKTP